MGHGHLNTHVGRHSRLTNVCTLFPGGVLFRNLLQALHVDKTVEKCIA